MAIQIPTPNTSALGQGGLQMAEHRDAIKSVLLVPETGLQPLTIPASGLAAGVVLVCPDDGPVDLLTFKGANGGSVNADVIARQCVYIRNTARGAFMDNPVPVSHVFGTQLNPFYLNDWSETPLIKPQEYLHFDFTNPSAAGAGLFSGPAADGRLMQMKAASAAQHRTEIEALYKRKAKVLPFWWTPDFNFTISPGQPGITLAAGGSGSVYYHNQAARTLVLTSIMATGISAGAAGDTTEKFTFQIVFGSFQRALQNRPVTLNCGCGTAAFPYPLPKPLKIQTNEFVRVDLVNLVTDQPMDVLFTFCGLALSE